tara:strand:- start:15 stop:908 length:894 start_codon:yes stop_codon:yes gene_type:complete
MNELAEEFDDDEIEIEIVDDTPEADQGRPRLSDEDMPEEPDEEELSKYSAGVKKRFGQMSYKLNEERRRKEEVTREREAAVQFAETIKKENERLRKSLFEGEGLFMDQAKQRVVSELEKAKAEYKSAYESGDPDALTEAQMKLTDLKNEEYKLRDYKPQQLPEPVDVQSSNQKIRKPDEKAAKWAEKNSWFMKDKAMTGYAMGVHEELIAKGIDPNAEEYYTTIDSAMRRTFPNHFDTGEMVRQPQRQSGSVVAPAGRSAPASSRNKVTLTASEAAIAKRLGVSLKDYAAQKMKDAR